MISNKREVPQLKQTTFWSIRRQIDRNGIFNKDNNQKNSNHYNASLFQSAPALNRNLV